MIRTRKDARRIRYTGRHSIDGGTQARAQRDGDLAAQVLLAADPMNDAVRALYLELLRADRIPITSALAS